MGKTEREEMKYLVTITTPIEVEFAGDAPTEDSIKDEAWFRLWQNNDPSNYPEKTEFTIVEID